MTLEKAVNHGDHGEHGVISKYYADFGHNLSGDTNDFRNVLNVLFLSVLSVVQLRFIG